MARCVLGKTFREHLDEVGALRTRTDKRHLAPQDVDQLRNLIEARIPKELTQWSNTVGIRDPDLCQPPVEFVRCGDVIEQPLETCGDADGDDEREWERGYLCPTESIWKFSR